MSMFYDLCGKLTLHSKFESDLCQPTFVTSVGTFQSTVARFYWKKPVYNFVHNLNNSITGLNPSSKNVVDDEGLVSQVGGGATHTCGRDCTASAREVVELRGETPRPEPPQSSLPTLCRRRGDGGRPNMTWLTRTFHFSSWKKVTLWNGETSFERNPFMLGGRYTRTNTRPDREGKNKNRQSAPKPNLWDVLKEDVFSGINMFLFFYN